MMRKGYLVKLEDEYGNSRTIYANAHNEYEASQIAFSKAENCDYHRRAFEGFGSSHFSVSDIYQKRNSYQDDEPYFDEHPWK